MVVTGMVVWTVTRQMGTARTETMSGMWARDGLVTGTEVEGLHVLKEKFTGTELVLTTAPSGELGAHLPSTAIEVC